MIDIVQHISVVVLSWLFWFLPMYLFIHFFTRKRGMAMSRKGKIVVAGKGATICTVVAAIIQWHSWLLIR